MKGLDAATRRILDVLVHDPRADEATLAERAGVDGAVARSRLERLEASGVLRGYSVRIDPEKLGLYMEALVTGVPTADTFREDLLALPERASVTRIFTLADNRSIAFFICGKDLDEVMDEGDRLAHEVGLHDVQITPILDTIYDDPGGALRSRLAAARPPA